MGMTSHTRGSEPSRVSPSPPIEASPSSFHGGFRTSFLPIVPVITSNGAGLD
jgi:hypothetical protein